MKRIFSTLMLSAVCLSFAGCVAIHSANLSDPNSAAGKEVTAEASGMGFLMLTVPAIDGLEKTAIDGLKSQCNGDVKNITTRLQMRQLVLAQSYKVVVTGTCAQ